MISIGALAAAIMVLAVAALVAPRSARDLVDGHRPPVTSRPPGRVATVLGTWLLTVTRRPLESDSAANAGRMMLLALAVAGLDLRLGAIVAIVAVIRPVLVERRVRRRHESAVVRELPEVIDLVRLSLSAGGSVLLAVGAVSSRPVGPVSEALADVVTRVRRGHRMADALDELPDQLGPPVRPFVRALVASERYGVELGPTLERIAADAREDRRRRAQTAARQVPVRMLLPLVLGVLPAFVLLTLVPTLVSTFDTLDLGGS